MKNRLWVENVAPDSVSGIRSILTVEYPPGNPIQVVFRDRLTAHRGKLLSGQDLGTPVHAGSFPRRNLIVLDSELKEHPRELQRILTHELAHFFWCRLGNALRFRYELLLLAEMREGARGELGWSAELRKRGITARDRNGRTRRWREYCCESFCDSAGWLYLGGLPHREFTLPAKFRKARRKRLEAIIGEKEFPCI